MDVNEIERIIKEEGSCRILPHEYTAIRADERQKFIAFIAEHTYCRTDCESFLNCDGKKCWNKYLDMYETEQKGDKT